LGKHSKTANKYQIVEFMNNMEKSLIEKSERIHKELSYMRANEITNIRSLHPVTKGYHDVCNGDKTPKNSPKTSRGHHGEGSESVRTGPFPQNSPSG
jgi:hypothetical protein